jgi:hypothetical protein
VNLRVLCGEVLIFLDHGGEDLRAARLAILLSLISPLRAQGPRDAAAPPLLAAIPAASPVTPAQPASLPSAPSSPTSFWDRKNILLASTMAAATAADFVATTRNLTSRGGGQEHNPVARVFTGSTGGRVAYFTASAAGTVGLSYLFHKTNHHKLERAALMIAIGCSVQGAAYSFVH